MYQEADYAKYSLFRFSTHDKTCTLDVVMDGVKQRCSIKSLELYLQVTAHRQNLHYSVIQTLTLGSCSWVSRFSLFLIDSAFYPLLDGKMSTSQRAVMLCGWEGNRRPGRK